MHAINRSMMNEKALLVSLTDLYGVAADADVSFWRTGIAGNDIYFVRSAAQKYMLKVYFKPALGEQIRSSIEIMEYLGSRGVNVPKVIHGVDGIPSVEIDYPEGKRIAVLFEYIEGEEPDIYDDADAKAIGLLVGTMYRELDGLTKRFSVRRIDCDYLVRSGIDGLRRHLPDEKEKIESLDVTGRNLWQRIEKSIMPASPRYGLCHGDLHAGNMIKTASGEIFLVDFDSCGYGYRVYDIGIYANDDWEAKTPEALKKVNLALKKFLSGYREAMPFSQEEEAVFPYMLGLRHLELLGMVLRNCVVLEGTHWIKGCLKFHWAWFEEWLKAVDPAKEQ